MSTFKFTQQLKTSPRLIIWDMFSVTLLRMVQMYLLFPISRSASLSLRCITEMYLSNEYKMESTSIFRHEITIITNVFGLTYSYKVCYNLTLSETFQTYNTK